MYAIIPRPTNWISHAAHPRGMVNVVSWCAAPMLVFMGLAQFAPPSLAEVIVTEWDDPVVEEFDPDNPPTDPPIAEGEDADAMPRVDWEGGANNGTWNSATNTYTVTTLGDITLSGHTDIRVPNNATEELREHENGHDRLNKHEYEQRAKRKMEDAFRRFVGSSFVGEGETDADRQEDARTKAAEERDKRANRATDGILKQMDTLNGKYDKLTEHGTSDDIDTAEGETQAKEEQDKAPKAGDEPKKPDESEQDSGAGDSPGAFFDDETQELSIGGNLIMDFATDPSDSILGRGEVRIEPLVLIGVQENATVLLSDTRLQIVDGTNEDVLLDGFVFEVAYMPSTVPGYAGMIQGYLDIPPPWADGIVNPIASAFLAGMQHASDVGDLTMLWFYVDHPLFDEEGQSLIPGTGVTGTLKMGVAEQNVTGIPTVSEWAAIGMTLLLLTAGTIVFFRGRHNKTAAA